MINFSTLQGLTIPEGVVTQIAKDGVVLWAVQSDKPIILEVEKLTATTYAGETSYADEQFILLDIYPKTSNSVVTVTYGGLTKTLQFSGTNAQQVFFGTFNGVSDSVSTPASGKLVIEGGCHSFACGGYYASSKTMDGKACSCITDIEDYGSIIDIAPSAFYGCVKIQNVNIPGSISYVGQAAFYNCTGLKSVVINEGVKHLSSRDLDLAAGPFCNCTNLQSVSIPSSLISMFERTFNHCSSLTNIIVADGNAHFSSTGCVLFNKQKTKIIEAPATSGHYTIPSSVTSIGDYAFDECTGLTSITIPNSVTSIGSAAFTECTGLTSITIPSSVTSIDSSAFYMRTGLTSVTFENPTGWYVTDPLSSTTTPVAVDVTDPVNNVTLITETYDSKNWYRA